MTGKKLYIISGPNGAGKTTASYTVLPKILNCETPRTIIATGGREQSVQIKDIECFKKIEEYVNH